MGRIDRQQMDPLYRLKRVQDPIQVSSYPIDCSEKSDSIFPPLFREEIAELLKKQAMERVQNPRTPGFYSHILLVPAFTSAKKKNGKLRPVIDLSY